MPFLRTELKNYIRSGRPFNIFGCGITGRALANFFRENGLNYRLFDERMKVGPFGEAIDDQFLPEAGLWIVASPSFIHHPWTVAAQAMGARWFGELDFFSLFLSNFSPIIAITGTNGKTSTTLLLNHLLHKNGTPSSIAGNIGDPIINFLPPYGIGDAQRTSRWPGNFDAIAHGLDRDDRSHAKERPVAEDAGQQHSAISVGENGRPLICEVSSFQCHGLQYFSPDLTIWTNFSPTHLDVHRDWQEYFKAKWNLVQLTKKTLIVHPTIMTIAHDLGLLPPNGLKILPLDVSATGNRPLTNPAFDFPPQRQNFQMAQMAFEEVSHLEAPVDAQVADFVLPDHRLHLFHRVRNLSFWNDSKATNSQAAKMAVAHLRKLPGKLVWITCGRSKGEDLENFRPILSSVDLALCFGEMGLKIHQFFGGQSTRYCVDDGQLFGTLKTYVAQNQSQPIGILLSPGFSSFDRFKSYGERGRWFESSIKALFVK